MPKGGLIGESDGGRELGCARGTVSKWRLRFARERLAGLTDAPRSGKPKTYGEDADRRILAALDRPPPGLCPLDLALLHILAPTPAFPYKPRRSLREPRQAV